jgi:hypothetical protein
MSIDSSVEGRLEQSRRVDWRFLLPDPQLRELACFGPVDPKLVEACRIFAVSLVATAEGGSLEDGRLFDTVVVADPTRAILTEAARRTRPGGWVYVEFHRPSRGRVRRTPRSAPQCAAILREFGCEKVQLHWHWPDFAACVEMIPLTSSSALRHALLVRRSTRRLGAIFRRVAIGSRLLPFLAPRVSILGRIPSGRAA